MPDKSHGKLSSRDQRVSHLLTWTPWILAFTATVPLPVLFLTLFFLAASTDSAAFYLLLSLVSLALGFVVGLLILFFFWTYRRGWNRRLRERLAADGITADEVVWFRSELSSEEKRVWRELTELNPLLADAYCETLAERLTATRIGVLAREETLWIERQLNRARRLGETDTTALVTELLADSGRAESVCEEAKMRLADAKARLQTIEAVAKRALSQSETRSMLQRLAASQSQLPLALEMARVEQEALKDIETINVNASSSNIQSKSLTE